MRDAIGCLRIIDERALEVGKKINICFVDWEKAENICRFGKNENIKKIIGIDWKDKKFIKELHQRQKITVNVTLQLQTKDLKVV